MIPLAQTLPELTRFGALCLTTPGPVRRLGAARRAKLITAIMLDGAGYDGPARGLLRQLEDGLGITEAHRIEAEHGPVVVGPFCVVDGAGEALARLSPALLDRRARVAAERKRIKTLISRTPVASRTVVDALNRSEAARQKALRAHIAKDRVTRGIALEEARRATEEATSARRRELDEADSEAAERERNQVTERHGGRIVEETVEMYVPTAVPVAGGTCFVERHQRVTRIRNVTRDGLLTLRDERVRTGKGGLCLPQYTAGLRFRELFEEVDKGLGSQFRSIEGWNAKSHSDVNLGVVKVPDGLANRIKISKQLARVEDAVRAMRDGEARLQVLRDVAGRGRNISELATSGSRRALVKQQLVEALNAVCRVFRIF